MLPNLLNRMQNNEGWLTNLSPGVVSQSKITLANHLHHKEKRRLFKTLAYILRIGACRGYGYGLERPGEKPGSGFLMIQS